MVYIRESICKRTQTDVNVVTMPSLYTSDDHRERKTEPMVDQRAITTALVLFCKKNGVRVVSEVPDNQSYIYGLYRTMLISIGCGPEPEGRCTVVLY